MKLKIEMDYRYPYVEGTVETRYRNKIFRKKFQRPAVEVLVSENKNPKNDIAYLLHKSIKAIENDIKFFKKRLGFKA